MCVYVCVCGGGKKNKNVQNDDCVTNRFYLTWNRA